MTEQQIDAGTEVQGIHDEIEKIILEVIRRIEVLTGLEGQGPPMGDHPVLSTVYCALKEQFIPVEAHIRARIGRKAISDAEQ